MGTSASAQTFTIDVLDDTFMLTNQEFDPDNDTGDTEDSFGGRTEMFSGALTINNVARPELSRDILLRFDVSAAAAAINDTSLDLVSASLTLNPRDERASLNQTVVSSPITADIYGLVSENEGWFEGITGGSAPGPSGELGAVSRAFLATPSSATSAGGDETDGTLWFSAGGGATSGNFPPLFDVPTDTTNVVLGSFDTSGLDPSGDTDLVIPLNDSLSDLRVLLQEWLAAPISVDDGNGGLQTSNAGLLIAYTSGTPNQAAYETSEGRADEAANLILEFAPGANGDFDEDLDVDGTDFLRWQREFPALDADDLLTWQSSYGNSGSLATRSGVPEPSNVVLSLLGLAVIASRRQS